MDDKLDERSRRIVEAAMDLAEQGGFDAVRLRDVAARADVALGTVYKRFRSKEEMLLAALAMEVERLEQVLSQLPPEGGDPLARVTGFFRLITEALLLRPNFSRAVLRATVAADAAVADQVLRFHARMIDLIARALNGQDQPAALAGGRDRELADLLQKIWFAALVGWMGGLYEPQAAVDQVRQAADWMLRGLAAE